MILRSALEQTREGNNNLAKESAPWIRNPDFYVMDDEICHIVDEMVADGVIDEEEEPLN